MTTLYITEYIGLGYTGPGINQHIQAPSASGITQFNSIALGSSSAVSAQLNANTRLVKLCSDTSCWLNYGPTNAVSATITSDYLPAGVVTYLVVNASTYIAGIHA